MEDNLLTTVEGAASAEALEAYKNLPKKRIHYRKTTYTKTYKNYQDAEGNIFDDISTWGRMNTLYTLLGNLCIGHWTELGGKNKNFDIGILRYKLIEYKKEDYNYQGNEYIGTPYKFGEAEIIGSELLGIEERLFLHETLLEYLEEGYRIEQLNGWIESLLNLCLQGYSARLIVLALILMKGG